eukprot:681657-Pelagomonas_calceolata.AAC.3
MQGIAAFASAAAPLLLLLMLAPRIATTPRGGAASSTDRSADKKYIISSSNSSGGSSSRSLGSSNSVEDLSSLTLALREATSRAQPLLQRFANGSSSSSSMDGISSISENGPSAVPAQGRMAGAGQLLKGGRPLAPSSQGRRAAAGGGVRMGGMGTGREAAGTAAVMTAGPSSGADTGAVGFEGTDRAVESGSAAEEDGRKAAYARQLIAAAVESNRSSSSSSSRWASRAQLRGSGYVLPDDAPKLVPVLCADGSLVFTHAQLTAPAFASKADVRWVEDGHNTLAEEVGAGWAASQRPCSRVIMCLHVSASASRYA